MMDLSRTANNWNTLSNASSNLQDCRWVITPARIDTALTLKFWKLDLEKGREFLWVYDGDSTVTLGKMGETLTDFVNSIESFDAKFDDGYTNQAALVQPFSNFSPQENQGKALFLAPPNLDINGLRIGGGAGCAACHQVAAAPPLASL